MRIIVCDDNQDAADSMAMVLRTNGHEVHVHYGGASCLQESLQWKPEVAFLDIGMPDITGYGVARQLRAALGAQVLLIAVTAYGSTEDRTVAFEAGFDVHLAKPVPVERVLALASRPERPLSGALRP